MTTFPFGIEFVCSILGLESKGRYAGGGESFYTDCPFCGRKSKLNVNVHKNIYRCAACDESGGMLKLYSSVREVDTKTATRELYSCFNGTDTETKNIIAARNREIATMIKKPEAADITARNAVYTALLREFSLTDTHLESLLKRGISKEEVERLGYKSYPQGKRLYEISKRMCDRFDLSRIPGFYRSRYGNTVLVKRKPCIVIPVRTIEGFISGFQLRYDNLPETATDEEKERYRKYTWFSSSEFESGVSTSGIEQIHFSGYTGKEESIFLTEGVLKADVASVLSGKPFIGLTGIANTSQLELALSAVKARGVTRVYECMDMDQFEKPEVKKASDKIHGICERSGLETRRLEWLDSGVKGIDDYCLLKQANK